jgi:putative SOS response-associated peptidase YedK
MVAGMCGRYASLLPPDEIARMFRTANAAPKVAPTWNLAPSQDSMVVRRHPGTGERHLDLLRWGLIPFFCTDPKGGRKPINARAETVATSPMFKAAFARRRCLVPAVAFYEWRKIPTGGKQPYAVARADGRPMAFAGVWEGWRGPDDQVLRTFAIITTKAGADIAALHDRMPVILEEPDWPAWLGEIEDDPASLLRPSPPGTLRIWPVSGSLNSPLNDTPHLLEPALVGARELANGRV